MTTVWLKDLVVALRTRGEALLSVAAPLVLLALASWIFTPTGRDLPIALIAADPHAPAVQRFAAALTSREGEPLYLRVVTRDPAEAGQQVAAGLVVAVVTLPGDFDAQLEAGEARVEVVTHNVMADLEKNIRLSLLRAVERFHQGERGAAPLLTARVLDARPVVLSRPGWFAGSMVIHALLFVGFLWGGIGVAREHEGATWVLLRASPTPGWAVALGKVAAAGTAATVAATVVAAVGIVTTDLRCRGDVLAMASVVVATAVFASSIGLILGLLARRYYLMMPLAGLLAVVLWFVGGGFSDLTLARGTLLHAVAQGLPTTYAFRAHMAVVQGGGWPQIATDAAVISGCAAVAAMVAVVGLHRALKARVG